MSSEEKMEEASRSLPVHTKKPDCPLCRANREAFANTVPNCYDSNSQQAGEQTQRF